jgi:hypothetical protein
MVGIIGRGTALPSLLQKLRSTYTLNIRAYPLKHIQNINYKIKGYLNSSIGHDQLWHLSKNDLLNILKRKLLLLRGKVMIDRTFRIKVFDIELSHTTSIAGLFGLISFCCFALSYKDKDMLTSRSYAFTGWPTH